MKKSIIAVLLIITVSTFAAFAVVTDSGTLNVATAVQGVNLIGVFATGTAAPTGNAAANWTGSYTAPTVNSATETAVGVVHTRSNNRTGYSVTMAAGPLSSSGTTTVYLGYVAKAYDGATLSGTSTYDATGTTTSGTAATIISTGNLTGITTTSRDIFIEIPNYATALEGSYTGTITFNYTSNN